MSEQHKTSEDASFEKRRKALAPIIKQARAERRWLYASYLDLWLSPDDIEKSNAEGRYLLDPVTIKLRDPAEYLAKIDADILKLTQYRARVFERIHGATLV